MNWEEAEKNIRKKIKVNDHVNTERSTYRKVLEGPEFHCNRNKRIFKNAKGYKIQIGSNEDEFIEVPFEMLKKLYEQA